MIQNTFAGNAAVAQPTAVQQSIPKAIDKGFGRTVDASVKSGTLSAPVNTASQDTTAKQTVLSDNTRRISNDNVANVETIRNDASPKTTNGAAISTDAKVINALTPDQSVALKNFLGGVTSNVNEISGKYLENKAKQQGMTPYQYKKSLVNNLYKKLGF